MTHTSTEQERESFEALASDNGKWLKAIERDAKGNYLLLTTAVGWMWRQPARRAPAAPVPQGWKLVPVELLERIQESLGSFVSDQGWGQGDMDAFDDLSALAAAPQPPEAEDKPPLVQIEWRDQASDWPWFWLLDMRGEWLHLQGADYPNGSAKHDGDCFWAHKSDVQTMRSNVGKPPIRSQP